MRNSDEFIRYNKNKMSNISTVDDDNGNITHVYWEHNGLYFCIVAPHSGNNWKWMLRINPVKTFDRWSVADIEEFYEDLETLNLDINYPIWIYKNLLNIYIDRYMETMED